ncbi:lipoprotein N-acyltransferase Lnb domain-containing protein [Flavobacterium cerinum]|uniref:DUF4105 domain-containing protein n=1 Tax=Flavobacterium cerinum TaxID=2502784 RepID=A0ABY5IWM5_9FLAO|nr:DUF4105 domain-containing protein [Flavobacterium cerinum]UUC47054.1 DUF4105 domain-containing protein [Flavobacterium cerinum]
MRSFTFSILIFFFLFSFRTTAQTNLLLSDQTEVSLLTCGSGSQLHSLFGHTALRIHNAENGVDVVFNYGAFDFGTPNFYLKFVKGDLQYFVATGSYDEFVQNYQYENRSIYEQKLALSPVQKQQLINELVVVLSSDQKYYTYKFIDRNCTTMVADRINSILSTAKINTDIPDTKKDYRTILNSYLANSFYEKLGINLIFGSKVDKQSDKLFLPSELMEGVSKTKIGQTPLAPETITVYTQQPNESSGSIWNNSYTFIGILLLFVVFAHKKPVSAIYLAFTGFMGLFLSLVGFYSFHEEVSSNYNALLVSPILLISLFFLLTGNKKGFKISAYSCFISMLIFIGYAFNKDHFLLMTPILIANVLILVRLLRKEKL